MEKNIFYNLKTSSYTNKSVSMHVRKYVPRMIPNIWYPMSVFLLTLLVLMSVFRRGAVTAMRAMAADISE
jgi:hypothetical protein